MLGILTVIFIHSAPFDEVAEGPRVPTKQKELSLKSGQTIVVSRIQFIGNQIVTTKELKNLTQIYLNTPISEAELAEIEDQIEEFYREKGHKKVRVTIPAKQKKGVLTIEINEVSTRK
ncbi:MAG: POTRA domain-containing protein [Simkaniaceae bacterium]|nr:POTRA domain-containing protein [Candidatus Sacchlamyda saccharinae]